MKPRLFAAALAAALLLARLAPAASSPDLTAADFAPGDAIVFVSLPDPKRSVTAWKDTALYKIWQEPEVQAFLGKPLGQIPAIPAEVNGMLAKLDQLEPRNLFLVLNSLDQRNPGVAAGFTFKGGRPALDAVLEKPIQGIRKSEADGKATVITYGSRTIEVFEGKKNSIALCVADNWCFVGSSVDIIKGMIDRLEKKTGVPAGLSENADFKAVAARLPGTHEAYWFVSAPPLVKLLLATLEQTGTKIPEESRKEMLALKALGAATALENGKLRDTIFGLSLSGWAPGKLSFRSMAYTTPETLLYLTTMLRFPDEPAATEGKPGTDDKAPKKPDAKAPIEKLIADLDAAGLPLKDIKAALENEASLQLEWPQGAPWPSPILAVELKDRTLAGKLLDQAIEKAGKPKDAEWKTKTEDGVEMRTLVSKTKGSAMTPTIAFTEKHLLIGLNPDEVRSAIVRSRAAGTSRLDSSANYKAAVGTTPPDQTLLYIDSRALFEKAYGMARSFAPMIQENAQVAGTVDLEKMPSIESIAKHLPPLLLTTRRTSDGLLVESSGALTVPQLFIGGFGLGAAGASYFKALTPAAKPGAPKAQKKKPDEEEAKADDSEDEEDGDGDDEEEEEATPTPTPAPKKKPR